MPTTRHDALLLASDLDRLKPADARFRFTELYTRGCDVLGLTDEGAATLFDTSVPNARRWRTGAVVPPGATVVLTMLRIELGHLLTRGPGATR